jgi:hypothetical protein
MSRLQRVIAIASSLIGLLVLIGLVSAFFEPGIQAALTAQRLAPTATPGSAAMLNPQQQPTATAAMTRATPTPVMTMPTTTILAQDTFQRANQRYWGTASDGLRWGADANNLSSFAIAGDRGVIANGQGAFEATLGPQVADADVLISGAISRYGPGTSNMGALLRWSDAQDWYKAYIDGAQLVLLKEVAGKIIVLDTITYPAQGGAAYTLRFRAVGSMLMAKVWPAGRSEPAAWMVTATDTSLTTGFGGVRVVILGGVRASITMFRETAMANQQ